MGCMNTSKKKIHQNFHSFFSLSLSLIIACIWMICISPQKKKLNINALIWYPVSLNLLYRFSAFYSFGGGRGLLFMWMFADNSQHLTIGMNRQELFRLFSILFIYAMANICRCALSLTRTDTNRNRWHHSIQPRIWTDKKTPVPFFKLCYRTPN